MGLLAAAIVGLGFLIAGFLGAKNLGDKTEYGCMIIVIVVVILALLFTALLTVMM